MARSEAGREGSDGLVTASPSRAYDAVVELTAASFDTAQRTSLARKGVAMKDGSFPIRNRSDLRNAIRAIGRARDKEAARAHIISRARALKLTAMLPSEWAVTADGGFFNQLAAALVDGTEIPEIYGTSGTVGDYTLDFAPITAAVAEAPAIGIAPLVPPAEWFQDPQLDGPTPLTVTADGRVYGHLAEFGKCHRGIQGRCVMAPRTKNGYAHFNVGKILTASGDQVPVGRLTVNAHHAPLTVGPGAAAAHYDHTGTVAAFVRAGEDQWGPWLAGATRSDATPEQIRDLRANPPSGDWRNTEGRGLELVAALAVPVPGFPVMAVTASAEFEGMEEAHALILGWDSPGELAIVAAGFDPSKHPHEPKGSSKGGEWASKKGVDVDRPDGYEYDTPPDPNMDMSPDLPHSVTYEFRQDHNVQNTNDVGLQQRVFRNKAQAQRFVSLNADRLKSFKIDRQDAGFISEDPTDPVYRPREPTAHLRTANRRQVVRASAPPEIQTKVLAARIRGGVAGLAELFVR